MNKTSKNFVKVLLLMLCVVLTAASILCMAGCKNKQKVEGEKTFTFTVTHKDGTSKNFTIKTTKTTVGEALLDEKLIAGEDSSYGLYVKTVDGETLDYTADGMYWAFLINGEYASTGVDSTDAVDGATYSFVATPG